MSIQIADLYLSDNVYLASQTSSNYEIEQLSNDISRQLSSKLDLHTGGSISGDVDIVDADLSINTFENVYGVDDGQSLAEKLNAKQDKILSIDVLTTGVYASQHVYNGIYLSTETGTNPKHLDYPNITANDMIATTTYVSSQLSNYLDKREGGEVSGDVGIMQHNINILSGNYIQTSTPDSVINYASKNAIIQADVDPHYGDSYAGTKAFCVLGLSSSTNQIKLSGDIQVLKDIVDGWLSVGDMHVDISKSRSLRNVFGKDLFTEGDLVTDGTNMSAALFSLTLDSLAAPMAFHLSAVDINTGIVTLNESLKSADGFNVLDSKSQSFFEDLWLNDDNAFYLVGFPELGNANVPNNFGQFASGGSVRTIGRQTHAEGRDNIADIRYAHVEGSHCTAAHMATHAEGFRTIASKRYSHSEGEVTKADGRAAHTEGYKTIASGDYSHAEGGFQTQPGGSATGAGSHAEGMLTHASGIVSHAEGNQTQASASGAHTEGQKSVASGNYSHAEGNATSAMAEYSHVEGNGSVVSGLWSHAEGYQTSAFGNYSHTEGRQTVAGKAKDGDVAATYAAHAEGFGTKAFGVASHAAGINVDVNEDYAFGWNGDRMASYGSHGQGSFNVNPKNGISGFYIGTDNFIQCVLSAVQSMTTTQKAALKTALGL